MVDRIMTMIVGVICLLIGLASIAVALVGDILIEPVTVQGGWWVLLFFGLGWLITSFWLLQLRIPWLERRERVKDWEAFWAGILVCMAGSMLMVFSFADPNDGSFHAPRLVVTLAGAMFFLGGLLPLLDSLRYDTGPLLTVFTALILTCFGGVAAMVVLAPSDLDLFGRLIFTPGALLLLGFAARQWYDFARRLLEWYRRRH